MSHCVCHVCGVSDSRTHHFRILQDRKTRSRPSDVDTNTYIPVWMAAIGLVLSGDGYTICVGQCVRLEHCAKALL